MISRVMALARVHENRRHGGPPLAAFGRGIALAHASMAAAIHRPLRCVASPPLPADTKARLRRDTKCGFAASRKVQEGLR